MSCCMQPALSQAMSKLFAVSDIHGYGHLLEYLLNLAGYNPQTDRLFLLGDYVNKGPDSVGTLDLVHKLCIDGAVALQGNNERKWLNQVPSKTDEHKSVSTYYQELIAGMPLWADYERFLFVHAGLRPDISLEEQTPEDLTEIRDPFFKAPGLPGKTVVFGHTSTYRFGLQPDHLWFGDGKLGIDTGAGHGYFLSLVELTEGWQWSVSVLPPYNVGLTRFVLE